MILRVLPFVVAVCMATSVAAQQIVTLESYLQLVERQHPSLRSATFEPELAEAEIRSALGRFDPLVSMSYEYKDKSGADKLNLFEGSLELPLDMMFGPKLKASYTRGLGTNVNPEQLTTLPGEGSVGISLPVLQGIFTDARRNTLRKAMLRPDLARAQYQLERNTLLRSAALRYWDWSEALSALDVADSLLRLAQTRATFIKRRVLAGESAGIDTVEIQQEVQRRIGERLRALRIVEQFAIDVSVFVWNPDGSQPNMALLRPFPLPLDEGAAVRLEDQVAQARALRPELQRIGVLQETSRLDSALASEFLRPYVELEAGLMSYDVSAISKLDYKIGVRVHQPLLFRQASAQVQTAGIGVQRADLSRSLLERMVDADVANAIVSVDRTRERLQAAEQEQDLARRMVDAEQQRFLSGDSSLLAVNLRERFYAEALLRVISARADLARAFITLRWATGTI
jgi:outer membrane protein TolC